MVRSGRPRHRSRVKTFPLDTPVVSTGIFDPAASPRGEKEDRRLPLRPGLTGRVTSVSLSGVEEPWETPPPSLRPPSVPTVGLRVLLSPLTVRRTTSGCRGVPNTSLYHGKFSHVFSPTPLHTHTRPHRSVYPTHTSTHTSHTATHVSVETLS